MRHPLLPPERSHGDSSLRPAHKTSCVCHCGELTRSLLRVHHQRLRRLLTGLHFPRCTAALSAGPDDRSVCVFIDWQIDAGTDGSAVLTGGAEPQPPARLSVSCGSCTRGDVSLFYLSGVLTFPNGGRTRPGPFLGPSFVTVFRTSPTVLQRIRI